jgi:hypothetical protein
MVGGDECCVFECHLPEVAGKIHENIIQVSQFSRDLTNVSTSLKHCLSEGQTVPARSSLQSCRDIQLLVWGAVNDWLRLWWRSG